MNNDLLVLILVGSILGYMVEDGDRSLAEKQIAITYKNWYSFQVFPSISIKVYVISFLPRSLMAGQAIPPAGPENYGIYILIWGPFAKISSGINFRWCVKFPMLLFPEKLLISWE